MNGHSAGIRIRHGTMGVGKSQAGGVLLSLLRENVRLNFSGKMSAYLRNEDSYLEPETATEGWYPDQIGGRSSGRCRGGGAVGSEFPPGSPAPCPLSEGRL